jgi:hypothetical protein
MTKKTNYKVASQHATIMPGSIDSALFYFYYSARLFDQVIAIRCVSIEFVTCFLCVRLFVRLFQENYPEAAHWAKKAFDESKKVHSQILFVCLFFSSVTCC